MTKYFYAIYSKDDFLVDVYNSISDVLISFYKLEKTNPIYRERYLQIHKAINKSSRTKCIKLINFNLKLYKIKED